ncbi:putative toxin-antitoxin system toxin component, PIN family [Polaromonas sp. DSR2-3-2]|uniref:putative toxin-antitoxin system toxin component, PIN family n=1 Tax=unclassified Polaromonas TaxID=2638319 RepID=UPI003CE6B6BC
MSVLRRVVLDTSTLVSAALRIGSVPHQALLKALGSCEICASSATLNELEQVLRRDKFDRYLDAQTRLSFVALVRQHAHLFGVLESDELSVQPACRDPKDNKFLALALVFEADAIISSDNDLLVLSPWRSIPILTPAGFVSLNPHHPSPG